jgi:hypothetical protein
MNDKAIALAHSLRADPHPHPDYRVCRTHSDLASYIGNDYYAGGPLESDRLIIAEDTESLPDGSAYCLTFCTRPGTGCLIYTSDPGMIFEYSLNVLKSLHPHQIFHNYLHDVVPFDALGLPIHKFSDTMVRAYHLCLGGGGDEEDTESKAGRGSLSLKVLAYRHLNMHMTSFKDTVYPYSVPRLAEWLDRAATAIKPLPKLKKVKGVPVVPPDKQLASLYAKSHRLATKLLTNTGTDWANSKHDPWKFIKTNWSEQDQEVLELLAGPIPVPSIAFIPEPALLSYACRDADATLRLHLHMRRLKPWIFYP